MLKTQQNDPVDGLKLIKNFYFYFMKFLEGKLRKTWAIYFWNAWFINY